MRQTFILGFAMLAISGANAATPNPSTSPDADARGLHWARDSAPSTPNKSANSQASANPLMTFHGGVVMSQVTSKAIYWGPSWANSSFVGDKITGLDTWYSGHNKSNYSATVDEYTGSNGSVQNTSLVHQGHIIDTSLPANGSKTASILSEVCKQISAGNITVDTSGNGYYPIYTDVKRGHASYCAWHSSGTCNGQRVQFAFFFNLDGDSGCDPQDESTGHSQGLAALANVTAHELSEARSDPASPGAWSDSSGNENGDKCAWTFAVPYVTFTDGTNWKLQGEWSNNAYNNGTGYANSSGQKGCVSGQ